MTEELTVVGAGYHHYAVITLKAIGFVEEVRAGGRCDDCVNVFEDQKAWRERAGGREDAADGVGVLCGFDI